MSRETVNRDVLQMWPPYDVATTNELTVAGVGEKLRQAAVKLNVIYACGVELMFGATFGARPTLPCVI